MRKPDSSVRIRDGRVGQRSRFQGTPQRARSDHRHPGWHVRSDHSKSANQKKDHRHPRVHHDQSRCLSVSSRRAGTALPVAYRGGKQFRGGNEHMTRMQTQPRTYNQVLVPRRYTPGKRRFSIYWTWSYPWEANRDLAELDNRFSTMTEVRRVAWPGFEKPEWDKMNFLQGIAGTLELFHRSTLAFQRIVGEATGHPVAVFQRIDQAGYKLPIDERILEDTDTLMVFGLDHLVSEQEAAPEEVEAIRRWLDREGTCLLLAPHHDVGLTDDLKQRQMEYRHHGDELVPRQQRFGQYTRSLMTGLGVPVINQFGLRPAVVPGTDQIAPLPTNKDLDELGLLSGVTTFNFHLHLPHYALTTDDT